MIKKVLHILTLAALLCSCVKEAPEIVTVSDDELGVEHDGKVTLGFNVDVCNGMSEGTKAMDEAPDIRNIYVAVFDESGLKLSEYVRANPITTGPDNDQKYQFTIQLKISSRPRILHFIANAPRELRFGTEQEVIGGLFSRYDAAEGDDEYSRKDAYWQRLVFEKIAPRPEGVDDGSQAWQDYNTMVSTLSNLKLIRNFSKVTLTKKEPGSGDSEDFRTFKIDGMWFVNFPDRGSIAPYNRNTGSFGTDAANADSTYLDYSNVAAVEDKDRGNYQGFSHSSTEYVTPSSFIETGDDKNMISAVDNHAVGYVYEREKALKSPMYLIIKGEFRGEQTYYKIAMQDETGSFYAMLRNFNYIVEIQDVTAAGYPSAKDALDGVPSGDISVNIDYQDLPNMSDGNARITVSATKLLIVGQKDQTASARFWYRYEPDINDHSSSAIHNEVERPGDDDWNHSNPHVSIAYEGTQGSAGAVISNIEVDGTDTGSDRYVTINTENVAAMPKTQTITIEGRNWDGTHYKTITRTVQLVLRDALEMKLSASPNTDSENAANVQNAPNQPVILNIGIETDLPSSVFPLSFKIDPSVNSLSPDNAYSSVQDLPVRTGLDIYGRPTYWFEKSISWAEYEGADAVDGIKNFPVYFKTVYGSAANPNATDIEVSSDLFVTNTVKVKNYEPAHFTNLSSVPEEGTLHKVGLEETFSFKVSKAYSGDITFRFNRIEPAYDSGLVFKESDGVYRIYTKTVDAAAGSTISVDVVPFMKGEASITISAPLFEDGTLTEQVIDADSAPIYVNMDGTGEGTRFIQAAGAKVFGNNLVPGMKATLTIYVRDDIANGAASIMLDRTNRKITLGKVDEDTSVPAYTAYRVLPEAAKPYKAPNNGDNILGFYDVLPVSVETSIIGSVSVPVYGIQKGSSPLAGTAHDKYNSENGTGWYVMVNKAFTAYHLYATTTKIAGCLTTSNPFDYASLFGFSSTGTTVQVAVPSQPNGTYPKYISGTSHNSDVSLANSGQNYNFQYNDGVRFNYTATMGSNKVRYFRQGSNTGNVQTSATDSNNKFNVYPVEFVAPESL